jgi:hypothetical protein
MTRKKKVILGIGALILIAYFGSDIFFSVKCLIAKTQFKENYLTNKAHLLQLENIPKSENPFDFYMLNGDTVVMTFKDSSYNYYGFDDYNDSSFYLTDTSHFQVDVDENFCLKLISEDTVQYCDVGWAVHYVGHYKSKSIDELLRYYKIKRNDFNSLVNILQQTNCQELSSNKDFYSLGYKFISYYGDGLTNCFGHSDGFFNYVQTENPDSVYFKEYLTEIDENIYEYSYWSFFD